LSVPENQPDLLRLFDGIKVEQKQKSVAINIAVAPELIDKLIQATGVRPPVRKR